MSSSANTNDVNKRGAPLPTQITENKARDTPTDTNKVKTT
jgi:hypothetical protein